MNASRRRLLAAMPGLALPALAPRWAQGEDAAPQPMPKLSKTESGDGGTFNEFTPQSERAVRRGDEWLMKTLRRDGSCGVDIGQPADIGCSSMVGLALLSLGNTPVEGKYSREIRQIVSFLLRTVDTMPSDDITSQVQTQLQNKIGRHAHTFFATTFLCEVLGEGYDPDPVEKAV